MFFRGNFTRSCPTQFTSMEDYDVYTDEEGEVFAQRANKGDWWEDCGEDGSCDVQKGYMVNSRSWAEDLQDVFTSQSETSHSGLQTRFPSLSVSF